LNTIPPLFLKNVPNTREVMADSLMRMLIDGPEVSLSGSPTVSPVTAALWASVCFLKTYPVSTLEWLDPFSIYFLALSQAPPVLEKEIAI
jgi:hypothetical protein